MVSYDWGLVNYQFLHIFIVVSLFDTFKVIVISRMPERLILFWD